MSLFPFGAKCNFWGAFAVKLQVGNEQQNPVSEMYKLYN